MTENTPEAAKATWISAHKQVKNARAFTEGWDDAQEFMRKQMTDLLERSEKERAELEARVEQLEEALAALVILTRIREKYHGPETDAGQRLKLATDALGTKNMQKFEKRRAALSGEHPKEEGDG